MSDLFKKIIRIEKFGEFNEDLLEKILGVIFESYER